MLFSFTTIVASNLARKSLPLIKINSITAAVKLLEVGNYPSVLLAEIYLLPRVERVLAFARQNGDVRGLMGYL